MRKDISIQLGEM